MSRKKISQREARLLRRFAKSMAALMLPHACEGVRIATVTLSDVEASACRTARDLGFFITASANGSQISLYAHSRSAP